LKTKQDQVNDIAESEYENIQNDPVLAASETQFWDPWFDQNNQKFVHTLYSSGNVIRTSSIPSRYGDGQFKIPTKVLDKISDIS